MSTINMQDRYQEVTERISELSQCFTVFTIRQNRREGAPTKFEKAAIPIRHLHVLDLSVQQMPDGTHGLLFRLNNAKDPTEQYPNTVLFGGQGRNQAVTKWLNQLPTADGRGSSFGWDDELLPVALDMLEVLLYPAGNHDRGELACQLPRVLGTKPQQSLLEALQAAAETPGDYNVFQTPCSGEVTCIADPDHGLPGYVRIVQKSDSVTPLAQEGVADSLENLPTGFQPLVAEENVFSCDEVPILPGTRPVVTVGQRVELGDSVLELDSETVGQLSESQAADVAAVCGFGAQLGHSPALVAEVPAMHIGRLPLYAGDGTVIPRGELYFDIVNLVDVDGAPLYQIFDTDNGIFTEGNVRVDLRSTAISWPRQAEFVRPSAATRRAAESRQRTRGLRGLGEQGALEHLVAEAQALPVQEYDLKLGHLLSGPFPLADAMAEKVNLFQLHIRLGDHARLSPAEKAEMINGFLSELLV